MNTTEIDKIDSIDSILKCLEVSLEELETLKSKIETSQNNCATMIGDYYKDKRVINHLQLLNDFDENIINIFILLKGCRAKVNSLKETRCIPIDIDDTDVFSDLDIPEFKL